MPEDLFCAQRVSFYGELLIRLELFPPKILRLSKGGELFRSSSEGPRSGLEFAIEEVGKTAIDYRLEFAHIDIVLADERRDLFGAAGAILVGGKEPVIERLGLQPLIERATRASFVSRRVILHELLDQLAGFAVPDRLLRCRKMSRWADFVAKVVLH